VDNNKIVVKNAKDSQIAFENAKSKGLNKPEDFMYMYSQDNKDFFKNIMDRKYINFEQWKDKMSWNVAMINIGFMLFWYCILVILGVF